MAKSEMKNIRFGISQWRYIQEAADLEGVSASQFVREAATARAVINHRDNGDQATQDFVALLGQTPPEID